MHLRVICQMFLTFSITAAVADEDALVGGGDCGERRVCGPVELLEVVLAASVLEQSAGDAHGVEDRGPGLGCGELLACEGGFAFANDGCALAESARVCCADAGLGAELMEREGKGAAAPADVPAS